MSILMNKTRYLLSWSRGDTRTNVSGGAKENTQRKRVEIKEREVGATPHVVSGWIPLIRGRLYRDPNDAF